MKQNPLYKWISYLGKYIKTTHGVIVKEPSHPDCTVVGCVKIRCTGDRLFCNYHRTRWKYLIRDLRIGPYEAVETLDQLKHFQKHGMKIIE